MTAAALKTTSHAPTGIALLVAAVACFAVLDTTTKFISASVPVLMALWFRYAFQAIATTLAVLPTRGLSVLRTAHPKYQLLRGLLLLGTSMFAFFSLKYMPVGEFTAIVMITPLVITLLASVSLGERVSWLRWALVVGGFAGTLLHPTSSAATTSVVRTRADRLLTGPPGRQGTRATAGPAAAS